jgi:sec-independent protein translocase protein TatB
MFDFAWSEIGLIVAVALVLIGPKDLPVAIRTVTGWVKKARRMAAEFQTHVDEMVREANLDEVRNQISEIRNFDIRSEIERHVDPDGSLRKTFTENPLQPAPAVVPATDAVPSVAQFDAAVVEAEHPPEAESRPSEPPAKPDSPAFLPPRLTGNAKLVEPQTAAPAFIPPQVVLERHEQPPAHGSN